VNLRYLSMSQLAEVAGIDRRTVKDRLAEVKPHTKEGKAIIFDAREALPILFGHDRSDVKMVDKIKEQELRFERVRADKLELELEVAKGLQVPTEEVAKAVEKEYTYVRSTLLGIPSRCITELAMETDPIKIKAILEDAINEALNHLQADHIYANNEPAEETTEETETDHADV
jgi:phage terminase Nu1 subunit (DNA packaging protein)